MNSPNGISDPALADFDARHRAQPRECLLVESLRRGGVPPSQAGIDVRDDAALEREAGIGDGGLDRRAHEHAGCRECHQRQRELTHDQHVAGAKRIAGRRVISPA